MKKLLVILMVCMLCVTGCGKDDSSNNSSDNTNKVNNTVEKNNQNEGNGASAKDLACTMEMGQGMNQDVNIKFDSKEKALSVDTTVIVDLTDTLGGQELDDDMRETLLKTYEGMFTEENGYKNAKVSISGNIVTVKIDLYDADDLKGLSGYKDAKKTFEALGYTCK